MRDYSNSDLEMEMRRPDRSALECVDYCLNQLGKEKEKGTADTCAGDMTYEELIGTLLLARDQLARR